MSDLPAAQDDSGSLSWDLGRTAARLVGYGWDEINGWLNGQTQEAQSAGYSDPEINAYLGKADPQDAQANWAADWGVAKADDHPAFADLAKAPDAPVSPLEAPGAARIADHAGVAAPPVAMPAEGAPAASTPIDFNTPEARNAYADAILSGAVSSPRDFAERYSGAFLGVADNPTDAHTAAVARAAGNLAGTLPSDEDLTDTAIAVAHSAGVELTPDGVKTVKNNVADQWAQDGRPLMELYQQANTDPATMEKLVTPPAPPAPRPSDYWAASSAENVAEANQLGDTIRSHVASVYDSWASWAQQQKDIEDRHTGQPLKDWLADPAIQENGINVAMSVVNGPMDAITGAISTAMARLGLKWSSILSDAGADVEKLAPAQLDKIAAEKGPVHAEAARIAQLAPEDREAALTKLEAPAGPQEGATAPEAPVIDRKAVEDLVPSYDAAGGFYKYAKSLIGDVLSDDSGVLSLPAWNTPQQAAEHAAKLDARADAQKSIITNVGRNEQSMAEFAQQLGGFQGLLSPHAKEFETELAKGPAGNPMGTVIGQFIDYIENRSTGVTLANSKLQPLADAIRDVNDVMKQRLQTASDSGLLGAVQFRDNYFRHLWKDPRGPEWDAMWTPGTGKQGSGQSLQQRTLPTIADGLRAGLQLKITNPIDLSLYDLGQKSRYLTALQIADEAKTAGHAYYALAPKNPGDAPLTGVKSQIPIAPDVGTMKLYGADGFHQSYNNWLSNGMFNYPASATAYERAQWIANMSTGLKLALPTFHARVTGLASLATGFGQSMDELARGEIGKGALHLAETGTVLPRIFNDATTGWRAIGQFTGAGSRLDKLFPSSLDNDVINYLRDAGLRMGPRQSVYKLGSETIAQTAKRGMAEGLTPWENAAGASREIVKAIGGEFKKIVGDPQTEALGKRLGMAPGRAVLAPLNLLGRVMQSGSAPLFDHWIPALKTGGAYRRLQSWLEANPTASEEAKWTQARQIAKDMDNRFGELNQDTLFYPKMAKQIANLAMLSDTWSYGTYRGMLGLLNVGEHGPLKYNPVYGNTLIGSMAAYALLNGVEQYVRTGQTPFQTDTPIKDFLAYRTGGIDTHGRPERGTWPAEVKEYFDLAKILGTGIAGYNSNGWRGAFQALPASADYALGKLNPAWEALRAIFKGTDAIGNFIFASPHTFDAFMKSIFDPIFLDTLAKEKKGSNFGLWSALTGDRQAPSATNWSDYIDTMTKVFNRNKTQQEGREKRENSQLVNPDPTIAAPTTRGIGGGRGGLSRRAARSVEGYFNSRTEAGGGPRTSLYDPYVRAAAEEHYRAQARQARYGGGAPSTQPGEPTVFHGSRQGENVVYRDRPAQRGQNAFLRALVHNEQVRRQRLAQRDYMRRLREQGLTLASQQP